ncbi:MAG: tripartite tricarboxylate transporter substrate binding protein, partial [Acetobacteraceae bacterium]|nr:tripartite tricarboxylate transporter substrate binding protein [Acetobacteraceae bacterium]
MILPSRRTILAASLPFLAIRRASAQAGVPSDGYPNRPIRLIVGFPPGGTTDLVARIAADRLGALLGQTVVVENRSGAGGNVGAEFVARSEPDGYTLLMCVTSSAAINYTLYGRQMPYRPEDLAAVGLVTQVPNAIFVTPSLPVHTLKELVDYARAHPRQLNHGSSGIGTTLHLTGELLKMAAGIEMTHVPFRGSGPMLQEVIAGRVQVGVDNMPSCIGHIREGRLRPLAVTGASRSPALPGVPSTTEAGFPSVQSTAWFGVQAPARTPQPIIDRLGAGIDALVKEPATRARLAELGGEPPGLTPDGGTSPTAFAAFIRAEITKW